MAQLWTRIFNNEFRVLDFRDCNSFLRQCTSTPTMDLLDSLLDNMKKGGAAAPSAALPAVAGRPAPPPAAGPAVTAARKDKGVKAKIDYGQLLAEKKSLEPAVKKPAPAEQVAVSPRKQPSKRSHALSESTALVISQKDLMGESVEALAKKARAVVAAESSNQSARLTPPPAPPSASARLNVEVVTSVHRCRELCRSLSSEDVLAVDCEGISLSRSGRLCLVQIATASERAYLFDIACR